MVYHAYKYIEMLFPRNAPGEFSWKLRGVHGRVFYIMAQELGLKGENIKPCDLNTPISPRYAYLLDAAYLGYTHPVWHELTKNAEPWLTKPWDANVKNMVSGFVETAIRLGDAYSLSPYRLLDDYSNIKFATDFLTKLVHELLNDHVRQLRNHDISLRERICKTIDKYHMKNGAFHSQTIDVLPEKIDSSPNSISSIIYRIPVVSDITDDQLADIVSDYFNKP